MATLPCISLWR